MLFKGREYYLAAILIIVISIFLFMWSFEKRKPKTREVVVLAVMTSIATLGRVIFFMLPQFKPCVAIIIITGIMLGKQAGFLCGALTAFVSDFLLYIPYFSFILLSLLKSGFARSRRKTTVAIPCTILKGIPMA